MSLRKKRTLAISMILCVLLALTFVPSSYADTYTLTASGGGCSDAEGTWDGTSKTCTLGDNLTGHNIVIDGDDIILDCDRHSITTGTGTGIEAIEDSGITIRNCFVIGYQTGIRLRDCANSTLVRNTVVDNSGSGISLEGPNELCQYNTVENNTAVNNNYGINIGDCKHVTITGNHSNRNLMSGMSLGQVSDSTVKGNNANANGWYGIEISFSSRNTLTSNTTNYNAHDGINISTDINDFTLTENTSNGNLMVGIALWLVDDSILMRNKTNSNGRHGIALFYDCHGNTVRGNAAHENGYLNVNGGYGYVDGYNPLHEVLDNKWLGNVCTENFSGGSIHGDDDINTGGELCKPQF